MKIAQQFLAASQDSNAAIAFYEEAIRATKFEGMSREGTQFQHWKMGEEARMKGKPFRDGITLHLLYLGLTMRRSTGVEVKDLIADLINYTQQVAAAQDSGAPAPPPVFKPWQPQGKKIQQPPAAPAALDDEWMKQALSSSIFVKWQQISSYVSSVQDWEMTPGNVDGIYAKTILPEFRRVKDPRTLQYWDMRMGREAAQASKSGRNFDLDKYNQITMPTLLWSRAQEYLSLDQKNRAVTEMVKLIKSYPAHPSVPDWINQVEQILQPAADASAPSAARRTACGFIRSRRCIACARDADTGFQWHCARDASARPADAFRTGAYGATLDSRIFFQAKLMPCRGAHPCEKFFMADTVVEKKTKGKTELGIPWNVVVHDDPVNLMSYVTMVFQKVFGYSRERAEQHMMEVHHKGRSIVWCGSREPAEHYVQQLHGYLLLATMEQST